MCVGLGWLRPFLVLKDPHDTNIHQNKTKKKHLNSKNLFNPVFAVSLHFRVTLTEATFEFDTHLEGWRLAPIHFVTSKRGPFSQLKCFSHIFHAY